MPDGVRVNVRTSWPNDAIYVRVYLNADTVSVDDFEAIAADMLPRIQEVAQRRRVNVESSAFSFTLDEPFAPRVIYWHNYVWGDREPFMGNYGHLDLNLSTTYLRDGTLFFPSVALTDIQKIIDDVQEVSAFAKYMRQNAPDGAEISVAAVQRVNPETGYFEGGIETDKVEITAWYSSESFPVSVNDVEASFIERDAQIRAMAQGRGMEIQSLRIWLYPKELERVFVDWKSEACGAYGTLRIGGRSGNILVGIHIFEGIHITEIQELITEERVESILRESWARDAARRS